MMKIPNARIAGRVASRQRGVVLIFALLAMVVLSIAAVSLLRSVDAGTMVAGNMALKETSISATDAGIEAAVPVLQAVVDADTTGTASANYSPLYDPTVTIPASLTASTANPVTNFGGTDNTVRYWIERMCSAAGAPSAATCHLTPGASTPFYRVTVRVDGARGTTSFAQAMFNLSAGIGYAIMARRDLKLDSSIYVLSTQQAGDVYSGGYIELSNNTHVSGTIEAQSSNGGTPAEGTLVIPAPVVPVPDYQPANYQKYARYRLGNDCKVYERTGGTLDSPSETERATPWNGWSCSGATSTAAPASPPTNWDTLALWKLEGDNSNSTDLLYVQGRVEVGSSPGYEESYPGPTPWVISIIATGDIKIGGNTRIQDFRTTTAWDSSAMPEKINDIFLMAGVDLNVSGTFIQSGTEGLLSARDNVWFSGTTTIKGTVVASEVWDHVGLLDKSGFSGDTNITYSGGMGGTDAVTRLAWREIK